jgi:hypothetical protein
MRVIIQQPPLDDEEWEVTDGDARAFLFERWCGVWPNSARLYAGQVSAENDVTPLGDEGWQSLPDNETFYAVVHPGDPFSVGAAIIGAVIVGVAAAVLLAPKIPEVDPQRGRIQSSPTNELSSRTNRARLYERIEDHFGTRKVIPSLLALPFSEFIDNVEYELAYLCVGRGEYDISEVREGDTLLTDIDGANAEIYAPDTSPNDATPSPVTTIGSAIGQKVNIVTRSNSINGQVATSPNAKEIRTVQMRFTAFGFINLVVTDELDFTEYFEDGDSLLISDSSWTGSSGSYNFDGTYTILSVGATSIQLSSPGSVSSSWGLLSNETGEQTSPITPNLRNNESNEIGPFSVGDSDTTGVKINFVALNGLYKDDGETQTPVNVAITVSVAKSGETTETFDIVVSGSPSLRSSIGKTANITPTFSGPYEVSFDRTTFTPRADGLVVQDEVKIRDLYAVAPSAFTDYGDVTTILTQTEATAGALAVKERQLNCIATRKVKAVASNGTVAGTTSATSDAVSILRHVALDTHIGAMDAADIDTVEIAATAAAIRSYFGITEAANFSFTFDDTNTSFEETVRTIASAIFCEPYRDAADGGKLKLFFERATSDSTLILNHRNTLVDRESRSYTFGPVADKQGVKVTYIDSTTNKPAVVRLPSSGVLDSDMEDINLLGVRGDGKVATLHAHRARNKQLYQTERYEGVATSEVELLTRLERIEIADSTRPGTQGGEIRSQDGLVLGLDRVVTFEEGVTYWIVIQHVDGSTEVKEIDSLSADGRSVTLTGAPSATLSTDLDNYARATYIIQAASELGSTAYLVSSIGQGVTKRVEAVIYDERYYQSDDLYVE